MKVCFLIRSLAPAGAETQLVALANGLVRLGHVVSVVVFYPGGELEERLEGVDLVGMPKSGRWDISFMPKLIRYLKAFSPDIVHGYLGLGNLLASLTRFAHAGSVVWGVRASYVNLDHYDAGAKLSFHAERLCSRLAHLIIVNSYAGHEYAASIGYPHKRMRVIPNGIDTQRYKPDVEKGQEFRQGLGIPPKSVLFGMVGRVDPMKGHDLFIEAAVALAERGLLAHFVCVGDARGEYAEAMQALSGSKPELTGRFHWLGTQKDLVSVYNGIDVLVSASRFGEGFSNVVGEAMACGTPCVVTDVGDASFIVANAGVVVPPEEVISLGDAMAAMANSLNNEGGGAVRARIETQFSLERMIASSERCLSEMINNSNG